MLVLKRMVGMDKVQFSLHKKDTENLRILFL